MIHNLSLLIEVEKYWQSVAKALGASIISFTGKQYAWLYLNEPNETPIRIPKQLGDKILKLKG